MFTFSLQTVLEVRERLEKIKYKEFSGHLFERHRIHGEIESRKAQIARAGKNADQVKRESPTAVPLQLYNQFRERLSSEIEVLANQLREQEQALEEKRKELVEARRAHRALEILRDKERERYERALTRQERAVMDEIASNYYLHQQ
jgi:flagellar export protein FliJ